MTDEFLGMQKRIRRGINRLIRLMIALADADKEIDRARLKATYRAVVKAEVLRQCRGKPIGFLESPPDSMKPDTETAYRSLYGFPEENAHKHLSETNPRLNIQMRHLYAIAAALRHLDICCNFPRLLKSPDSWLVFLNHATKAVINRIKYTRGAKAAANTTNRHSPTRYKEAPHIWLKQPSFDAEQALAVLQKRPYTADIKTRSQQHITENREILIRSVLERVAHKGDTEALPDLMLVIDFNRIYFPKSDDFGLWDEPRSLTLKMGEKYSTPVEKAISYRTFRVVANSEPVYESFFHMAEKFKHAGDGKGFAESTIKMGIFCLLEGRNEEAKRHLLAGRRYFEERQKIRGELEKLHVDGSIIMGELFVALCRCETALGNREPAFYYSNLALGYASQLGDRHCLGNIEESLASLEFEDGQFAAALSHQGKAIRWFESAGDEGRAHVARELIAMRGDWKQRWSNGTAALSM